MPNYIETVVNYIPTAVTLFIFFAFLKNKNVKKFEAGSVKYEAKDDPADPDKGKKDTEQDKTITGIIAKIEKLETVIENDMAERNKRYSEFENRLDKQYEYVKEAALKSCTAVVFADGVPLVEFLDGVFTSLYLGNNGNTIKRITKRIVKSEETLGVYNSELSKFRKTHPNPNPHFEKAIEQIHREWH